MADRALRWRSPRSRAVRLFLVAALLVLVAPVPVAAAAAETIQVALSQKDRVNPVCAQGVIECGAK